MQHLALALVDAGHLGEALPLLRDVLALEARHNSVAGEERRVVMQSLAGALGFARRDREALALLSRVESELGSLPEPSTKEGQIDAIRRARLHAYAGEWALAHALSERNRADLAEAPPSLVVPAQAVAAMTWRLQGRPAAAAQRAERAWNSAARLEAPAYAQAVLAGELASAWIEQRQFARAEPLIAQALALFQAGQVAPSANSSTAWIAHARWLLEQGRALQAERALRPVALAWQEAHPGSAWHAETLHWLARAVAAQGREAEARALRAQAGPALRTSPIPMLAALAREPGL